MGAPHPAIMSMRRTPPRRGPSGLARRVTAVLLAVSMAMITVAAAVQSVAAVDEATVYLLNGAPGKKVDLCFRRQEIRSWIKYGDSKSAVVAPGTYFVRIREARKGTCNGPHLVSQQLTFQSGSNNTIVVWKPRSSFAIKHFVNDLLLPGSGVSLTMRKAAKQGLADVWVWKAYQQADSHFFDPTFARLAKGQSRGPVALTEGQTLIEAYPTFRTRRWSYVGYWTYLLEGGAYQAYIIGTKRANYRIAVIGQEGVPAAP